MPLNAQDASVAVFVRGLTSLKTLLTKGEGHAAASGRDPAELIDAQLAADMNGLAVQVHWAAEGAKMAVDRLLGTAAAPGAAEPVKSFEALRERIDTTVAYLRGADPAALEAGLERAIAIEHRGGVMRFTGSQFLLQFAIPSFFFHLTTAYALLRHEGVPLTKGDFLGPQG
jgi:hypothetical protein